MDDEKVAAIEARFSKSIVRAGVLAGISAVVTAIVIGVVISVCWWGWRQVQFDAENRRTAALQESNAKVSTEFSDAARKSADLIYVERNQAVLGWNKYKQSRDMAKASIAALQASAKTDHEREISQSLAFAESGFSICVGYGEIRETYSANPKECQKDYPSNAIDEALKQ